MSKFDGKIPDYKSLDPRTVLKKTTKHITHPYYYRYEGLRKICILILRRLGYNVFEEIGAQVFGIVIDMAYEAFKKDMDEQNEHIIKRIYNTLNY